MFRTVPLAFAAVVLATPAFAFGNTAYLSSTGSGVACTQASPCNAMISAVAVAGAGGEVICLNRGNYNGSGTIAQAVTISCGPGMWGASAGVVTINTPAGADVVIEGLVMDELTLSGFALRFIGQGSLHLRGVRVGNFTGGATAHGLFFNPNGPATLHVNDSIFYNNTGSGIQVQPAAGGFANVHLKNVKFERNGHGLFADGSTSTIGVNVNMIDSVASENAGNGVGASSVAGKAAVTVSIRDSLISGNLINGLGAAGAAASGPGSASISVANTMITANANGVATGGAGQIRTYGNNQVEYNGANGAFTGTVGLH